MIRCNGAVCAEFRIECHRMRGIRRVILSRIALVSVGVAKQTPGENEKAKYQTFTHQIRVPNAHCRHSSAHARAKSQSKDNYSN